MWEVDQATADGYLVADNRLGELSHADLERRRELLVDFREAFGDGDFSALGFTLPEVEKLLKEAEAIEIREIETKPVADTFWITVRGPLASQAYALQRLQELMAELPDVSVELGTVRDAAVA
ncbi:MAG TPA: hypothetical protein VM755_19835 [Stellaceae bacterium]|nr:hypothetical protein [Stellaceae bacterium]